MSPAHDAELLATRSLALPLIEVDVEAKPPRFTLGALIKARGVPNDQATYGIVIGASDGYSTISMLGHEDYRTGARPGPTWCFIQHVANSRYEVVKEPV